ncbi:MAG: peptidase, partial [Gammaproteobacteria bacterium]|nr:peptidase [Gammaproteobacteria bacterium]
MLQQKIKYRDHQIMTFHAGAGDEGLLLLSGGPGCPSNFLQDSHAHYADPHFKVITWDQLGCGLSDRITDKSLWNIPRFVEEVEAVRQFYGLKKVHL